MGAPAPLFHIGSKEDANSAVSRLMQPDVPPVSETDEEDYAYAPTTGSLAASGENTSLRFKKYHEIDEMVGMGHLLCEECERFEAVCKCEECDETLCSRCFILTHPPRAGGAEHDHLRHGLVRGIGEADASGATGAARRQGRHRGLPCHFSTWESFGPQITESVRRATPQRQSQGRRQRRDDLEEAVSKR